MSHSRLLMRALVAGLAGLAVLAGLLVACTVNKSPDPLSNLAGPSELGLSITVTADPDSVPMDGVSQSSIVARVRDANGQPASGRRLRFDALNSSGGVDDRIGQFSSRAATSNAQGVAAVTFTPAASSATAATFTLIRVVPIDFDASGSVSRVVQLNLIPAGPNLPTVPTGGGPKAAFTFSPTNPTELQPVFFDGTSSTDTAGIIVSYSWNFGDGVTKTGPQVVHDFSPAGTFLVTLTVTDDRGLVNSLSQSITISNLSKVTPEFDFSPTTPGVGQVVRFNASKTTTPTNVTITKYAWDFGDGSSATGLQVSHAFAVAGTYNVILAVTDSRGQTATITHSVPVGATQATTADFVFSPSAPARGQTVQFNASTSTAASGATIVDYSWNFGDGFTQAGSSATVSHVFAVAGTYNVTLTVTDSRGVKSTKSATVTVS